MSQSSQPPLPPEATDAFEGAEPPATKRTARKTPRPLQAAMLLSALYLLARLIGLAQYAIINANLSKEAADAYYAAFRLPDIVNYIVAGGAMSVTFIPIFTELKLRGREADVWKFFSTVATLMGVALLVLIVVGLLFTAPLVSLLNPGFTEAGKETTLALTISMTRVLLPAQICFYLGGMIVGVLNAHKRFGASGLTGAVYNFTAIIIGLIWYQFGGPIGFAWGILVGAFIGTFLLPWFAAQAGPKAERIRYSPCFDWNQPAVKKFFINALPIMLGVSLPVVDQIVVGYFASNLPPGDLRNLQTGNRFMLAPLGIVAQAASVAAFPYLASDSASQDWARFADFLRTGLRRLVFLTLPLSILLILLAQPIINLLKFGKFDQIAAGETAAAFALYCVGLFAWAGQQLVARGFYALQDTRTPTIIGSALTIFFFIPLVWLMTNWGVRGLAFATSIGAAAHFSCVLIALNRRLESKKYNTSLKLERLLGLMLRTGTACVLMALAGLIVNAIAIHTLSDDKLGDIIRIAIVTPVACAVFAYASQRFAIPEWKWLRDKFGSKFTRKR